MEEKDKKEESNLNLDLDKEKENKEGKEEKGWKEEFGLEKFADEKALAKSYVELQKKMGENSNKKKVGEMTDEELIAHNREVYGNLSEVRTSLDGEYGKVSESAASELGIPTKISDAVVGKTTKEIFSNLTAKSKEEANKILSDAAVKEKVINGVKSMGDDYKSGFQKRLDEGKVSIEELSLLSNMGTGSVETDLGLEGQEFEGGDQESLEKEYLSLSEGEKFHAIRDPKHPNHLTLKSRKEQLERALKIPKTF